MAGGSVAELILFIAALSVAGGVAGVMVTTVNGVSDSIEEQADSAATDIKTEFTIISDPGTGAVYDATSDELTLLLKNTGSTSLPADEQVVEVLVDGQFVPSSAYSVTGLDTNRFRPGTVVRLTVDRSLAGGDHVATVTVRGTQNRVQFRG
ncbi:MAG: putative archaeal flagellar protein G [halophilic archaeon J07HX5]|jgi:Putative archaeal flagellar protein G|nr:MAG: putative archaeal flagellar protein G [halophilic archaeon J07HX5]